VGDRSLCVGGVIKDAVNVRDKSFIHTFQMYQSRNVAWTIRSTSAFGGEVVDFFGGVERDRTADLLVANSRCDP
jgi:hypothetical protein